MLEAKVKYLLLQFGKLMLLTDRIPGRFAMGIPDPESKENDDLGLMPPIS